MHGSLDLHILWRVIVCPVELHIGNAAHVNFLMRRSRSLFSASHYAFATAVVALGSTVFGLLSGRNRATVPAGNLSPRGSKKSSGAQSRSMALSRSDGVSILRLETGIHQIAAVRFYERMGFYRIPPAM